MPAMPDFSQHNEEVKQIWASYQAGCPLRVPFGRLGTNSRIWILDPRLNHDGVTWKAFSSDPELMFTTHLKYKYYLVHNIPQDIEMGIPEKNWEASTEFGNVIEEAWLGCEVIYPAGQVSATVPRYSGDRKEQIFEQGLPTPFSGIMGQVREFHHYFVEKSKHFEFHGRPVSITPPTPLGTDGPFTVAIGVRGTELLEDMLIDEDYYHRLMDFITEAIIRRILAWRQWLGVDLCPSQGGFADDAIQFLSVGQYRQNVLPYHQRLMSALYGAGPHSMHLCGSVQRHFPTLVQSLNINSFDTGYPICFDSLRDEVGEEVEILGGVPVNELLSGTAAQVFASAKAILQSGVIRGGRFVMKEANNLPPRVPIENISAVYAAVKQFGRYSY
jgi:hypothetical protein